MPNPPRSVFPRPRLQTKIASVSIAFSCLLSTVLSDFAAAADRENHWDRRKNTPTLELASLKIESSSSQRPSPRRSPVLPVALPPGFAHEGKRHWPLTDSPIGWRAGNTPIPFVLHLRETHDNVFVQKNISRLVVALEKKNPDLLIGAEGAWGRVSFARFERIADPDRRRGFADALLEEGLLTGEEHAVAAGLARRPLWGVEDERLHTAHIFSQTKTRRFGPAILSDLKRQRAALEGTMRNALSKRYRDHRAAKAARLAGKLDLTAHIETLLSGIPAEERSRFPLLTPLLTVQDARKKTGDDPGDSPGAEVIAEWSEILGRVQNALTVLSNTSIDDFSRELNRLEQTVDDRLLARESTGARASLARERWLDRLTGLWSLTLTPDQWADYKVLRDKAPDPLGPRERAKRRHPEAFYEIAERRDAAMTQNLQRLLEKMPVPAAVLVTGGFHGGGIETHLEKAGVTYAALYVESQDKRPSLRPASALIAPTSEQAARMAEIAERLLTRSEAAPFRSGPPRWALGLAGWVGLVLAGPALAVDLAGVWPGAGWEGPLLTMAGWAGVTVALDDNERLLSWRSRLQDLFPRRKRTPPPPPDEEAARTLAAQWTGVSPGERAKRMRRAIVDSPPLAAGALAHLGESDRRALLTELDPKFRGDLLHGLEDWARAHLRRKWKHWSELNERLLATLQAPAPGWWPEKKAALEKEIKSQIDAMGPIHRDLLALRWAHASPIPKDRSPKENPIIVAAGVLARAMDTRQKLLEGISAAPSAEAAAATLGAHGSALAADAADFIKQTHALDADRLSSPLVPRIYRGWSDVVARLGADNLKPDFLIRSLENGDVLAAANAGEEIQAAIEAGWLDIVSPESLPPEETAPFSAPLDVWEAHALHPVPSKWGLAVWPNDLTKMNFSVPLAARLAAAESPRRLYRLRTARLFGDHTRQTEVSKALAQLLRHLGEQGHAVLLMDMDIYQTEKQDVLQRAMNEWKKLPAPPPVIGVCTELTHKMRLETKTRDLFDPVVTSNDTEAIDRWTLSERLELLSERLRFQIPWTGDPTRTLLERARAFTGFAWGDFTARWVDRAVTRSWRRLLRTRESKDPFKLTDADLEDILRDRPPEHLRPLRDRIANVLPRLTDAQRRDLLREFNDMSNPSLSRQEAQKTRLWIEEFIEIHSLPMATPVLGGGDARDIAPALFERAQRVFARSHFGMDAVVHQVEGILTKIIQSERRAIVPESDYLCLIGPPGVGKTSILLLIGEALGRPVKIISGTKIQTEEDLKGFLRTYVNSHSGELVTALRSGPPEERVRNPIVVIDEVDKIPPAIQAILLQVLDPAQNSRFEDFYAGETDLSEVEFVLTGNDKGRIIGPLINRMQIETLNGYTEAEKIQIAARFMLPKVLAELGLRDALVFPRAGDALAHLIRLHDREQGVRELERLLERIVLFAAKRWALNGRRAPVTVDAEMIDACLKTPTRPRLPLSAQDTVGLAHFPAANGFAFALETRRDTAGRVDDGSRHREWTDGKSTDPSIAVPSPRLRWFERLWRRLRYGGGAPRLPAAGDPQTAPALKEILDLAGRLVGLRLPEEWVIAAPRSGTPPDPSAGLAAAVSLVSAETDRPVKRETVFLGALDNRGGLLPVPDLERRLFGAIDAGAVEVVLPRAQETEVRALAAGVIGLRGPLLQPGSDGMAELSIPLPGPSIFANGQDPTWLEFLQQARQRPEHRPGAHGFLAFSGPVAALRALARESLDATPEPQTLYVLVDRWDRAIPFAFREPGEAPRARKTAHYADSIQVQIPQEPLPPSSTEPQVGEGVKGEFTADRAVLFMNDNYRRRMVTEPATRVADDLFEAVVENYDPTKVASAEAVLRSALVHNPAVAARFFIRMIDVWITGDKMLPGQRRAIMDIFGTLPPDTVGSMLLASAQFGSDTLLLRIRASALDLQKALVGPGNKTAALATLTNLRAAFQKEGGDGDLPHPIDDLARRLNAWDPARSPAVPADLVQWADSVARRALLFVNDIEQAHRAPLVGDEAAARDELKTRFPDYANQPVHELFELNHRGVGDLAETLGVYTAGRLLEDMAALGFVTEHRPLAPLNSPEDDLLDPVLRGAGRAVADQAATSALRHTVLLSCPDPLRAALPDYLARYLWRDGLPRRVLRLNTLNLQMANTEFADDTSFAWRRMQRVIQNAARQGNCLLVIDLDEFQKNVPLARHAIDLGRILAVANDSAKPLPLVFVGSEAAHLRFQESVTAYGDQVIAFSLADVPPGAVLRAQVGQVERARERPILAAGVLSRIVQQIHDRALGLRGAQRLIDRLSALPAPADLETFQRERDKMDAEDQRGSKDLSIEQRFERESYRLPPSVRAQAEKFLGLWVASSGDEAAKLEHRLRLILDFPYPRVPSAEQKARDTQILLGDLPDTLRRLRETLDAEFFGMDEVKDRIEDFVTRTLLSRAAGSPPRGKGLLLVGPPGTAKTTIVLAISEALGIPMTVVPCGAVKDAQYFVGFDSGFLGSKIGKLCEAAIRMGVPNGIYLLDEIEKMRPNESGQHPGDVFLQILDPKQNTRVREKFLGVDTDYSQNLFIATANGLEGIPAPLLDRFDVVALTGYNKSAKAAIGQKLVRRLIQKWRIEEDVRTPDLPGVIAVAVEKTHAQEKGVRQLGKALNAVFKAALTEKFKSGLSAPIEVTPDFARRALRAAPLETTEERPPWAVGRVQGLAVMSGEGEEGRVLEIEADLLSAPQAESPLRVVAAGRAQALMDFSQQSALPAALGWLERNGGPTVDSFRGKLIALLVLPWHIPKDGDSAGTAFTLAILSALTGRPLRQDFTITGAISRGGKIQSVGGIADKVTKAQQVAKTIFLPRENENDLLSHLLKSPDQIHFVESRRAEGHWERALYVMPRAFTNAGLPASAVDRFVRDAKGAGLAAVYDPAMKSNEWIKIAGTPESIESFFQSHRGVMETPPLHVLADRLEDVVERVLGDASDTRPDPLPSPSSGGSGSSFGSALAASAPGLASGVDPAVQAAVKGLVAVASVLFTPWNHAQSAAGLMQNPRTGADHNRRVRESLALLNPLVNTARPAWAESIKTLLARWKPDESNTPETMDSIREQVETAIFPLPHREQQAKALAALSLLGSNPEARPRPDSSAVPVLALDWNSVLSGEGKGLLRIAEAFLAESPRARVVLAGSPHQKSAMERALSAGPLASRTSRVLILNNLPTSGSVNTEEVKEWIRERLGASGVLGEGGLRFRLGATPDQAQRWTNLLHSLLVFSREVVVPAAVWNQMKPHLQGDPGVDNPDGSHTLPAREYSLADLLKSIAEDIVIQTQA